MKALRLLLPTAMLALAACSPAGATNAPTGAAGTTTPVATSGGTVTQAPGPTSGGGIATDWCLNTGAEVDAALGVSGTAGVSTDAPGVGGGCLYSDGAGTFVYAISVVTSAGAVGTFDAAKLQAGAVVIDGIGDDAVLVSPGGPLVILKGSKFASIGPTMPALMSDPAAYRAAVEQLGTTAAGRM